MLQRYLRTIQLGIKSLLLHKLRSGLTMLGIIFGVCSVIAMLAIGEGASYEAQEAIKKTRQQQHHHSQPEATRSREIGRAHV